jgi:hypothetical protein
MNFINNGKLNGKPISLEKFREQWLRGLVQHRDVPASVVKVAVVLGFHINRKTGLAFPGMRTISRLTTLSTSTVSKAVKWLEVRGYVRVQPGRTPNATNRYLPLLKREGTNGVFASERTGCSPQGATDLPTNTPREPLSYNAPTNVGDTKESQREKERGDNREGNERRVSASVECHSSFERSRSTIAECYRLAIKHEGKLGGSRVGLALKAGGDPEQILQDIIDAVEDGGDLGLALCY